MGKGTRHQDHVPDGTSLTTTHERQQIVRQRFVGEDRQGYGHHHGPQQQISVSMPEGRRIVRSKDAYEKTSLQA